MQLISYLSCSLENVHAPSFAVPKFRSFSCAHPATCHLTASSLEPLGKPREIRGFIGPSHSSSASPSADPTAEGEKGPNETPGSLPTKSSAPTFKHKHNAERITERCAHVFDLLSKSKFAPEHNTERITGRCAHVSICSPSPSSSPSTTLSIEHKSIDHQA